MESFRLGPFAFSAAAALLIAAAAVAFFTANRIVRKSAADADAALWIVLLAGVSAARIAFVAACWANYASRPWTALDLRDGGFNAAAGIAAAMLVAALLCIRKRALLKPLALSLAAGFSVWAGAAAVLAQIHQSARLPDAVLADLDGKEVSLAAFAGKPVVVNLWATWCPPCRREMPVLRDAQLANRDVVFVFANQRESGETVKRFLQSDGLALDNVLLDPHGALAAQVGAAALPTTLIFDASGKQVNARVGAVSAASLAQLLASLRRAR